MLAFVHIPKAAGTTVKLILRSSFGMRHCNVEPWRGRRPLVPFSASDLRRLHRFYPRLASIGGHRVWPHSDLDRVCSHVQYFTFFRDPLERSVSHFQYQVQRGYETRIFEDWVRSDYQAGNVQTKWIAGSVDVDAAIQMIQDKNIFVGLTECFDESMLLLKSLVANDLNIAYKRKRVARDNTLARNLLTPGHTREMIVEANRADLELYTYVKQELYPSYRREYGDRLEHDLSDYKRNRGQINKFNVSLSIVYQYLGYVPVRKLHRVWSNL